MPRPKGSVNKVTAEVKEQLQNLIDTVVNRIDVDAVQKKRLMEEAHKRNLSLKENLRLLVIIFFLAPLVTQSLKI